jgi:hypothetical protein
MRRPLLLGLGLTLAAPAAAQPVCPERLEPGTFRQRLDQVLPGVTSGEAGIGERLKVLEATAVHCIDGPLFSGDLATLFLAQGIWALSQPEGDARWGQTRVSWAAAIGGEGVWRSEYDDLRGVYDAALAGVSAATLVLQIRPTPPVLVLDGQVEYDMGARSVNAGAHLIQWMENGGWTGELVVVAPGATETFARGEAPAETPTEGSVGTISAVDTRRDRPEVDERWVAAALFVQRYSAVVSDGLQVWEGSSLSPGLWAEGRYEPLEWLAVRGQVAFSPEGDEANPAVFNRLNLEAAAGWGDFFRGELLVGLAVAPRPIAAAASGSQSPPSFEEAVSVGPRGGVRLAVGDPWRLSLEGGGALTGEALELGGGLAFAWPIGDFAPFARLDVGKLQQPGVEGIDDQYRWAGGALGVQWRY